MPIGAWTVLCRKRLWWFQSRRNAWRNQVSRQTKQVARFCSSWLPNIMIIPTPVDGNYKKFKALLFGQAGNYSVDTYELLKQTNNMMGIILMNFGSCVESSHSSQAFCLSPYWCTIFSHHLLDITTQISRCSIWREPNKRVLTSLKSRQVASTPFQFSSASSDFLSGNLYYHSTGSMHFLFSSFSGKIPIFNHMLWVSISVLPGLDIPTHQDGTFKGVKPPTWCFQRLISTFVSFESNQVQQFRVCRKRVCHLYLKPYNNESFEKLQTKCWKLVIHVVQDLLLKWN